MRLAVLSDTHGNLTAFEAVLADIGARGINHIFNLGDLAGKGPRGSACCDLTRARCEGTVTGNWDVFLTKGSNWWRDELTAEDCEWLATLPFHIDLELAGTRVRLFHASSDDVMHRIYPTVSGVEWDELFQNTEATGDATPEPSIVIYGDIHHAWSRTIDGRTLLNCGSVGNPLDETTASYLILNDASGRVQWELIRVPYDVEAELTIARELDMPTYEAWAHELRTAEYAR